MSIDFNRYIVQRTYYGKFDDIDTVCSCMTVKDANMIRDLLNEKYKDRPMIFKVKKTASDYYDFLDDEGFTPPHIDIPDGQPKDRQEP